MNVIWLESLFTGYGSSASGLRHYNYTERDTVTLHSTKTTYALGPYETVGVQNNRAWFAELRNYASLTPEEVQNQNRDRELLARRMEGDASPKEETDDLAAMMDIQVVRRELLNGMPVVLVTLKPNSRHRPSTEIGTLARRFHVRAWLTEDTHDVVRLEAEVQEPVFLDLIFPKGSTISIERQWIGEQAWLPVKTEIAIPRFGRIGAQYSNFRRFYTDVQIRFETGVFR